MKKILICGLFITFLFTGCNNNDPTPDPNSLLGDWINYRKDTITFEDWGSWKLLIYKNYEPHLFRIYRYNIENDSTIRLTDEASSQFSEITKYYYFRHRSDSIEIHNFRDLEIGIYKRINKK